MRGQQPLPRLHQLVEDLVELVLPLAQPLGQRRAVDQLHHHEHPPLELARPVHGQHMRMVDPRHGLRLTQQPGQLGLTVPVVAHDLDRDRPIEAAVVSSVDHPHPARAEPLLHPIATDGGRHLRDGIRGVLRRIAVGLGGHR